jgi:hypothetical protein
MRTYEHVLEELEAARIWAHWDDYFYISGHPLELLYKDFFAFGQHFLDRDYPEFAIHPARMFFDSNPAVNACARRVRGYSIVEICQGAITEIFKLFSGKDKHFTRSPLDKVANLFQEMGRLMLEGQESLSSHLRSLTQIGLRPIIWRCIYCN